IAVSTERIGLGTAVLVPNLRNPVVTASAIATIEHLAPGRLACGFGTGATARWALGQDALTLKYTGGYLRALRALLRREVVAVDVFPGGADWRKALEAARPENERHLTVHEGHAVRVTDLDRILVDAAGDGIAGIGWVAEADGIRQKLAEAEAAGATEIIYAPS